jgi:hypothetical protein
MSVEGKIERNSLASLTSFVTLASQKITGSVGLLIGIRTVTRIDLVPMILIQQTATSQMIPNTSCQLTNHVMLALTNDNRIIMSPTATRLSLGYDVNAKSHISVAVLGDADLNQIVTNKNLHVLLSRRAAALIARPRQVDRCATIPMQYPLHIFLTSLTTPHEAENGLTPSLPHPPQSGASRLTSRDPLKGVVPDEGMR